MHRWSATKISIVGSMPVADPVQESFAGWFDPLRLATTDALLVT